MLTERGSVLPDRRSVRSGAARLRSTSDSRFHPILVPELIAVVIEEVLERVSAAIERNAALLCAIFARLKTHGGGTASGPWGTATGAHALNVVAIMTVASISTSATIPEVRLTSTIYN